MTTVTINRGVLLGVVGIVALLIVNAVLMYRNIQQLNDDAHWVAHTHEVIDSLEEIHADLRAAESIQRSYLITGGERVSPEFAEKIEAARTMAVQVMGMTTDNPDQQFRLPDLIDRINDLETLWMRTIRVRKEKGFDAAQQIILDGQSTRAMAELLRRFQRIDNEERAMLQERQEKSRETYFNAIVTGLVTAAMGLLAVVLFFWLLTRFLKIRQRGIAQIHEQRELLQATLASVGDAVIATDLQGRVTFINPVAQKLTGWTSEDAARQPLETVFRIVNEDTREVVENPAMRALRDGRIVGLANHTILISREGTECPIDDSAAPIRDVSGRVAGAVLVFRDVTEHRLQQRELESRERQFRILAESIPQLCWMAMPDGHIFWYNQRWYDYTGTTFEQMAGWGWKSVHDPEVLPAVLQQWEASLAKGEPFDRVFPLRGADGNFRQFLTRIVPLKDDAGHVVRWFGTNTDITDTVEAEAKVRASEQHLRAVLDTLAVFVGVMTPEGILTEANRAALQAAGLSPEDVLGKPFEETYWWAYSPEVQETLRAAIRRGRDGQPSRYDVSVRVAEGRFVDLDFMIQPMRNEQGQVTHLIPSAIDITKRKRTEAEREQLAADLSEANHRKDEFLAMLAHELRNPLAPIRTGIYSLRQALAQEETTAKIFSMLDRQIGHMVRLVDDLLDVSRISRDKIDLRKEAVELVAILSTAIETSRPLIEEMGNELSIDLPETPIVLNADLTRLAQVFSNLLNNAAKYSHRGDKIHLSAVPHETEVEVVVRDTGIGLASDKLTSIFDMFSQIDRSLEKSRGGLGIGLTLVKRLVELHSGTVEARSDGPGRGSEFVVRLPILESTPAPDLNRADPVGSTSISALRILVVDDNRDSADSLGMMLEMVGHDVRTAYDGEEAVNQARAFQPHVILLDIGLPKLNGYEACRRIREQAAGRKLVILAQTGWGKEEDRQRTREAGFDHHLVKPVDPVALQKILGEVATQTAAG